MFPTGRHGGRLAPAFSMAFDGLAMDPPVSQAQRKAMFAAASGHSTLGIPPEVGAEFVGRGRHNGRASDKAGVRDLDPFDAEDASPETIQRVWNLWARPGTEGEKAAAAAAMRRLGVDPEQYSRTNARPASSQEPPQRQQTPPHQTGPKRYDVTLQYVWNGKTMQTPTMSVEAGDEIEAEAKARQEAKNTWKLTVGGKALEFRHYKTTRI
jgi:hypothetical protein